MKMKIGLISRGRTRSTAITESLAAKYNIPNKHEIYTKIPNKIDKDYILRRKNSPELEQFRFKTELTNITEKLFSQNDFICKLWPSMLIYPHKMSASATFDEIKRNIVFDITRYIKINQYDKLYFLDRELHISTCSWIYSYKVHIYHYYKTHITRLKNPVVSIAQNDYDIVRFYILEYCLQQKLKIFLEDNNISFQDITENYQDFIDDSKTRMQKSNNDYRSLITNYDELQSFITDWYPTCLENTKDWKFT